MCTGRARKKQCMGIFLVSKVCVSIRLLTAQHLRVLQLGCVWKQVCTLLPVRAMWVRRDLSCVTSKFRTRASKFLTLDCHVLLDAVVPIPIEFTQRRVRVVNAVAPLVILSQVRAHAASPSGTYHSLWEGMNFVERRSKVYFYDGHDLVPCSRRRRGGSVSLEKCRETSKKRNHPKIRAVEGSGL